MVQFFLIFSNWALLVLRVVLGAILVVHGRPKLKNLKETAGSFEKMGLKLGSLWGAVVAIVEFAGGIFLILGFLTQIVSLLVFIELLVILAAVKRHAKFKGEVEFDLLILAGLLVLITMGGGALTLDQGLGLLIY